MNTIRRSTIVTTILSLLIGIMLILDYTQTTTLYPGNVTNIVKLIIFIAFSALFVIALTLNVISQIAKKPLFVTLCSIVTLLSVYVALGSALLSILLYPSLNEISAPLLTTLIVLPVTNDLSIVFIILNTIAQKFGKEEI